MIENKEIKTSYSHSGPVYKPSADVDVPKIEILIKALGTMVMMPEYTQDPTNIGAGKVFTGMVQTPILMNESRKEAENKLLELIKTL